MQSFRFVKHEKEDLGVSKTLVRGLQSKQTFMSKLKVTTQRNIVCSALSPSGTLFLFSTITDIAFFYLQVKENDMVYVHLNVDKDVAEKISGSTAIQFFSCDGVEYVICVTTKEIVLVKVNVPKEVGRVKDEVCMSVVQSIPRESSMPIYITSISNDGKWFALLQHTLSPNHNITSCIHIYKLTNQLSHYWTLHPPSTTTTITIYNDILLLSNTSFTLYMYDLTLKKLSDWNIDNDDHPIPKNFHDKIDTSDYPIRILPVGNSKLVIGSYNFFHVIDLDLKIPSVVGEERNFTICKRFKRMLCMDCLGGDGMVVVEFCERDFVRRLCDPLERKEYGT